MPPILYTVSAVCRLGVMVLSCRFIRTVYWSRFTRTLWYLSRLSLFSFVPAKGGVIFEPSFMTVNTVAGGFTMPCLSMNYYESGYTVSLHVAKAHAGLLGEKCKGSLGVVVTIVSPGSHTNTLSVVLTVLTLQRGMVMWYVVAPHRKLRKHANKAV